MAERTVKVVITGSSAGAVKAFTETALASDAAGKAINKSSSGITKAVENSTSTSGISLSNFGKSLFAMVPIWGKVAIAAAVVVAGVVTGAVVLAAKYQEVTNKMAAQAGITLSAAKKIGDAFLTTGGQTTFSAQQMMAAFGPVSGQLGLLNGKALNATQSLAFMRAAMNLAEATGTSLATTTASLAAVMQAYGIPVKGAATATDLLFNASRTLNMPIDAVASSVEKLHTKLGPLAPSLSDVTTLLEDVSTHGLTGSRGLLMVSTGLNTLLTASQKNDAQLAKANTTYTTAVNKLHALEAAHGTTRKAIEAATAKVMLAKSNVDLYSKGVADLNLKLYDSKGHFVGVQSVIAQLGPKLAGMTEAQRLLAEKTLFGAAASKALDATIMAGVPGWKAATTAATQHGTAQHAAAVASSGLSGSMAKVSAALQDAGVKLGNFFLPILTTVMGWVAKAAQAFAYILPGALNILGGIFNVVGKVIGTVIAIWSTEIGIVINVIKTIVGVVTNVVNAIKGPIGTIAGFFKTAFGAIASIVGGIAAGVTTAVKAIINTVIGVINFFIGVIDTVIGGMNAVLGSIPTFGAGKIHIGTIGKIPTMDTGGIVTKPTLAFLAMNSRPEAVVPLGTNLPGSGGAQSVVINVVSNDGTAVVNALKRYFYANGPIPITVNRARTLGS